MAKKIIAVVPLWDDEKESIWMLPGYMNGIKEAGAIPVILPLASDIEDAFEIFERCDGLLMTGGHDVSPSLYKEPQKENCGVSCNDRDLLESALYAAALAQDKPVLGICRGIQLINVLQGGTLYHESLIHDRISPLAECTSAFFSLALILSGSADGIRQWYRASYEAALHE